MTTPSGDSQGHGGPQQPWNQGQPGGQPPAWGQPAWGQAPGGYGQPGGTNPYEQPPKKSRGPLIAGLVALILVVVGGIIAAIILLSGDDDDSDSKGSDDETSQASESAEPSEGSTIEGNGYVYTLPERWIDATDEFAEVSPMPSIDTVSAWGETLDNSRANFIVETMVAGSSTTPEDLRESWEATVTNAVGGLTPLPAEELTVDGSEAIGMRFEHEKNSNGVELVQLAYLFVENETAYAVTLSMQSTEEETVTAAFDEIISSWSFQD